MGGRPQQLPATVSSVVDKTGDVVGVASGRAPEAEGTTCTESGGVWPKPLASIPVISRGGRIASPRPRVSTRATGRPTVCRRAWAEGRVRCRQTLSGSHTPASPRACLSTTKPLRQVAARGGWASSAVMARDRSAGLLLPTRSGEARDARLNGVVRLVPPTSPRLTRCSKELPDLGAILRAWTWR